MLAEKFGGEAVARRAVEVARLALLDDAPAVHDDDAVGKRHRLGLVVGDVDRRDAEAALQGADILAQLLAQFGVEIGERLVEKQDVRLDDERASERDALLLTAGELARIAFAERGEIDQVENAPSTRRRDLVARNAPHLEAEGDIGFDGHVRKQRVGLEHQADIAVLGRQAVDAPLAEADLAAVGLAMPAIIRKHGRLAASRRPEKRDEFAVGDIEIEIRRRPRVALKRLAESTRRTRAMICSPAMRRMEAARERRLRRGSHGQSAALQDCP